MDETTRTRVFADQTLTDSFGCWWTVDVIKPSSLDWLAWTSGFRYDRMDDCEVPHFYTRSKRGEIFVNPLRRETVSYAYVPTVQYYRAQNTGYPTYGGEWTFDLPSYWKTKPAIHPASVDFDRDYFGSFAGLLDSAVSRAWSRVDRAEFQALASLGELPETLRWVTSIFRRFVGVLRLFASGKLRAHLLKKLRNSRKNPSKVIDELSNAWLELRYAVRPLFFEIAQALKALKEAIEKTKRYTGRGFEESKSSSTPVEETYNTHVTHVYHCKKDMTYSVRAGVLYRIVDNIDSLLKHWGLDQPVEAIWELTPFSFIIDWFFSVGDTISSWSVDASLGILGSWGTERLHIVESCELYTANIHSNYDVYQIINYPKQGYAKREIFATRRLSSPARTLIPSFRLKLDTAKLVDLITIGRNLLK